MRKTSRGDITPEQRFKEAESGVFEEVVKLTGGRLAFLGKAARARDIVQHTQQMLDAEKSWMLDHIGLIPDHDDDVMDEACLLTCIIMHLHN